MQFPHPSPTIKLLGINLLCQPWALMWLQLQPLIQDHLSKKEKPKSVHPAGPIIALILQHAKAVGIEICVYVLHTLLLRIVVFQNSFKISLICQILVLVSILCQTTIDFSSLVIVTHFSVQRLLLCD